MGPVSNASRDPLVKPAAPSLNPPVAPANAVAAREMVASAPPAALRDEARSDSLRAGAAPTGGTFKALRHRNFQIYVGGQLVSLAGTWMQNIAQGWLVYEISGSAAMLGVVGFAAAIPAFLIAPWAGVVIDRTDKRQLLVVTQVVQMLLAFVLAALTFTGLVQVWHVVLLAVVLGAVNSFDGPARQAFVVDMVGRDDLPNAIAINSMTFNAARVVGPAFGGLLLATVGSAWCFAINGFSFLAVIVSLVAMRIPTVAKRLDPRSPWEQLKSGVAYSMRQPDLRGLLLLALFFSTFGIAYMTVLPAFVDRVLGAGPTGYGLITSAAGVGAVSGALFVARYGDGGFRGRMLFTAAMVFPVVLTLFALNTNFILALLLTYLLGVGFMLQFTQINTLLQTRVEDDMRGRVLSLYTLTFFGFTPFGNLLVGALGEALGLSTALIIMAAITLVSAAVIFWRTPQLKQLP
jgi:predicted MFS family arabinose efflux permease